MIWKIILYDNYYFLCHYVNLNKIIHLTIFLINLIKRKKASSQMVYKYYVIVIVVIQLIITFKRKLLQFQFILY